jgi:hypothetical protein
MQRFTSVDTAACRSYMIVGSSRTYIGSPVDYQEVSEEYFQWVLHGVKGGGKNSGKGGGKGGGKKRSADTAAIGAIGARSGGGSASSASGINEVVEVPEDSRAITHIVKHHVCSGSPL